ncbi:hypothetical protein SB783_47685, partial [Paraburkholderia sp. SIMBA_009]
PELVAECNFAEWTSDGVVRQASFVSLRSDKPAKQIVHEAPSKGADVQQMTEEMNAGQAKTSTAKKRPSKTADVEPTPATKR